MVSTNEQAVYGAALRETTTIVISSPTWQSIRSVRHPFSRRVFLCRSMGLRLVTAPNDMPNCSVIQAPGLPAYEEAVPNRASGQTGAVQTQKSSHGHSDMGVPCKLAVSLDYPRVSSIVSEAFGDGSVSITIRRGILLDIACNCCDDGCGIHGRLERHPGSSVAVPATGEMREPKQLDPSRRRRRSIYKLMGRL